MTLQVASILGSSILAFLAVAFLREDWVSRGRVPLALGCILLSLGLILVAGMPFFLPEGL